MGISSTLDRLHYKAKQNRWLRYFTVFNRIVLAAGFLPSGMVKIMGERFTSLSVNHPMGNYLEALHHTGYYYTFIGALQVLAAVLLLIPRTALLGALIYFPIILNICILSFAVRFEGSLLTSPLMVLANLYLLCWDYDKLKSILFRKPAYDNLHNAEPTQVGLDNRFPVLFFAGVVVAVFMVVLIVTEAFTIQPHNTLNDCRAQCKDNNKSKACYDFCECIHTNGKPLDKCLEQYNNAAEDSRPKP